MIRASPLRAFRLATALVAIADLVDRAADLRIFYTDDGLLPRAWIHLFGPSIHALSGSFAVAALLFGAAFAAALALALGVRPRVAALALFVLSVSLQHRSHPLLGGGDVLLAHMLVWAAIADQSRLVIPCVAAQLAALHIFAGLHKVIESPAWRDGSALGLALSDAGAKPLGVWLRGMPGACAVLGYGVLLIELGAPLLLMMPWRKGAYRCAGAWAIAALHVGILMTLEVGIFPYVVLSAVVPLLVDSGARDEGPAGARSAWRRIGLSEGMAAVAMALMVWQNLGGVWPKASPPEPMKKVWAALGLAQDWSMYVELDDPSGWFTVVGLEESGKERYFLPEGAPPPGAPKRYAGLRWHGYMSTLLRRPELRHALAAWVCEEAKREGAKVTRVEIRFACEFFCNEAEAAVPARGSFACE